MKDDLRELTQSIIRKLGLISSECCESCCELELSVSQSYILHEIVRLAEPSMQQVAERLNLDITTFSRQIKALVEKGLVEKAALLEDRRVSILSLTERGRTVQAQADKHYKDYLDFIFSQFTEFEKETVIRSLKLLEKAISKPCC